MPRKQLQNIFTTSSAFVLTFILTYRLRLRPNPRRRPTIRFSPTLRPRLKHLPEPLPNDVDELEKMEMTKNGPIPEIIYYQWHDWLIKHTPESIKKLECDTKKNNEDI